MNTYKGPLLSKAIDRNAATLSGCIVHYDSVVLHLLILNGRECLGADRGSCLAYSLWSRTQQTLAERVAGS
jgi:hypothetical protein